MKKAVAYSLEAGHVPSYISDGGYFASADDVLVGVTVDNPDLPTSVKVFDTELDLLAYLESYKTDWTVVAPYLVDYKPTTPTQAAQFIWSKLSD